MIRYVLDLTLFELTLMAKPVSTSLIADLLTAFSHSGVQ